MVDFRGPDLAPEKDYNKKYYIFAVVFIFIGGFFSLNLFVGVVVNTYKYMHKEVEGGDILLLLTETQKFYYRAMVKFSRRAPSILVEPPKDKFSRLFYRISKSWWFSLIICIVICANATVVAIQFHAKPEFVRHIRKIWEAVFTSIYFVEFLIKIIGQRKFYFKDYWNIFSLAILILDIIGEIIQQVLQTSVNLLSFVYAFRILQIFHLLHLAKFFTNIRLLTYAIVGSFTSLLHLSVLMCLVIFIYSILGMSLFGHIKHHSLIDDFVNFETLINSAILLFRLSTAEDYDSVYKDLTTEYPFCDPDKIPKQCGNKVIATFYLLTYVFLTNHLITNIFIAVILDNYKEAIAEERFIFKEDNLISFYKDWKQYDPKATQFIAYEKLSTFLDGLNSELRVAKPNKVALAFMDLPITAGNKVHCLDVLKGIMRVKFGTVEDTEEFRKLCEKMQQKYENMFPELKGSRFVQTTMNLKRMDRAARIIQNRLKEYKAVKQMYSK
ncbi:Sodium channel protein 60E [Araneus ventricosus]|uniref:Calcium-channel protein CCH1 n=1 Tax=Araneus ventricosus TaxID=182803 RepID=A0A4Y2HY55_ARAVE|nr:Sodium channel protein 60E [Araneus ventricosus]